MNRPTRARKRTAVVVVVVATIHLLLLPTATAARSQFAFVFRRIPPLDQELGSSPTLSRVLGQDDYFFDPLELASDDKFARYREAELKHGRVAMLATIGMIVPNLLNGSKQSTALKVMTSLTVGQYLQIFIACGFLEAFVFVQQDPKDMPGDYGTGYFGVRDKGEHER